jgi:dihydropteroate synthase
MSLTVTESSFTKSPKTIDEKLSKRPIALDPSGYFIIYIDRAQDLIFAKFFTNNIDERGLAVDPATGKPIPAKGSVTRQPSIIFQARTAKELCVEILERSQPCPVTLLDHAAYLGREAQKAEWALLHQQEYIQD